MVELLEQNRILWPGPFLIKRPLLSALGVFYLFQMILEALGYFPSDFLSGISAEKQQFLFIFRFSILYSESCQKEIFGVFYVKHRV